MTNLDKYKEDLDNLIKRGYRLQVGFLKELGLLDKVENKEEVLKEYKPISFNTYYEVY